MWTLESSSLDGTRFACDLKVNFAGIGKLCGWCLVGVDRFDSFAYLLGMKPLILILVLFFSASLAQAQSARRPTKVLAIDEGRQGIGILLGKPAGFRYTYWLNWRRNLMADLAYDFDGILYLQGQYGIYFYNTKDQLRRKKGFNRFLFYLAPGTQVGVRVQGSDTASSFVFGLRGMTGVEYLFSDAKWSVRAEVGPTFDFVGRTLFGFSGYVGGSYYFGQKAKYSGASKNAQPDRGLELDDESSTDSQDDFSEFE